MAIEKGMQGYKDFLQKNGINPTVQRIKILDRLSGRKDHPTIGQIYEDLIDEMPSLSKTTVYNTLNLFMDKGLIRILTQGGQEARYDFPEKEHGHFLCLKCKKIYDIGIDNKILSSLAIGDNKVITTDITLKGICSSCLNME